MDLWKTLINSNPNFGKARLEYLAWKFQLDPLVINAAISKTEEKANGLKAEGFILNARSLQSYLIHELMRISKRDIDWYEKEEIFDDLHRILQENPPKTIKELHKLLRALRNNRIKLYIVSNASMVSTSDLLMVSHITLIDGCISSEDSMIKPWSHMIDEATFFSGVVKGPSDVLHVGDSDEDEQAAKNYRCDFLRVNTENVFSLVMEKLGLSRE